MSHYFQSTENTWMASNNVILNNGRRIDLPVTNFLVTDYFPFNRHFSYNESLLAENQRTVFNRPGYFTGSQNPQVLESSSFNHDRQEQHEEVTSAQVNRHRLLLPSNDLRLKLHRKRNNAAAIRQNVFSRLAYTTESQNREVFDMYNALNHYRQERNKEVDLSQVNRHILLLPPNDLRWKLQARRHRNRNIAEAYGQNIFRSLAYTTGIQNRQVFDINNTLNRNTQEQNEEIASVQAINRHRLSLSGDVDLRSLQAGRHQNRNIAEANGQNIFRSLAYTTGIQNRQVFYINNILNRNRQEQNEEIASIQAINRHKSSLSGDVDLRLFQVGPNRDVDLRLLQVGRNRNRDIAAESYSRSSVMVNNLSAENPIIFRRYNGGN